MIFYLYIYHRGSLVPINVHGYLEEVSLRFLPVIATTPLDRQPVAN